MVCFWAFHTVSYEFHAMYIEETLHKSDYLYFFIGGNSGIGTWNYTKAILMYMDFILGHT